MPRHTFTHRAVAAAPPAIVWQALQRPEAWGAIGGVRRVDEATFDELGELTGYRFFADAGGATHMGTARRSSVLRGRRMTMEIDTYQLAGQIAIDLEPDGGQTAVRVDMTVLPKGVMGAIVFPLITGALASGFVGAVEAFVDGLAA